MTAGSNSTLVLEGGASVTVSDVLELKDGTIKWVGSSATTLVTSVGVSPGAQWKIAPGVTLDREFTS